MDNCVRIRLQPMRNFIECVVLDGQVTKAVEWVKNPYYTNAQVVSCPSRSDTVHIKQESIESKHFTNLSNTTIIKYH